MSIHFNMYLTYLLINFVYLLVRINYDKEKRAYGIKLFYILLFLLLIKYLIANL